MYRLFAFVFIVLALAGGVAFCSTDEPAPVAVARR